MTSLNAVIVDGRWSPGIGDPSVVGWLTVLAYFAAAALCWRAARRTRIATGSRSMVWIAIAVLMVLLGINKQLDLQSLATQIGRDFLQARGAMDQRRTYQVAFILSVTAACLAALIFAIFRLRRTWTRHWPVIAGLIFLSGFILMRAASFHRIDAFLGRTFGGLKWNWILELTGIALILWGAATALSPRRQPGG